MIDPVPTDQIIKGIIEYPSESRGVELKSSTPWVDVNHQYELQNIVRSILGISNVKDGGKIVLGIKQLPDKTFVPEGMSEEHLRTFNQDDIYQLVRSFGNPEPRFEIKNMEHEGKFFIVFFVQEFLYSPVICIKNGKNTGPTPLVEGAIYTRTNKPETKRVDRETEMREIINLAVDKEIELLSPRLQRLLNPHSPILPGTRPQTNDSRFSAEVEDLIL